MEVDSAGWVRVERGVRRERGWHHKDSNAGTRMTSVFESEIGTADLRPRVVAFERETKVVWTLPRANDVELVVERNCSDDSGPSG